MNGVGTFHFCSPHLDIPNDLSSDQNEDHIENLCHLEVYLQYHHFRVHKNIGVSSSREIDITTCFSNLQV